MTIDLEERLERELPGLVVRSTPSRGGLLAVEARVRQRRRRRRGSMLGGGLLVVVVGLVAFTATRRPDDHAELRATFRPPGLEVPLMAVAPSDPPTNLIVKPGSSVSISYPGRPALDLYITIGFYEGHAVQEQCLVSEFDGGGCTPFLDTPPQAIGISSTIDNGGDAQGIDHDLWSWTGLPDSAAFVSFADGAHEEVWQRPIAGVAAFQIDGPTGDRLGIAYDSQGNVVARSDEISPAKVPQFPPVRLDAADPGAEGPAVDRHRLGDAFVPRRRGRRCLGGVRRRDGSDDGRLADSEHLTPVSGCLSAALCRAQTSNSRWVNSQRVGRCG